jgi:enoyl-CoA hydratase/carnithine racemase
VTEIKSAITDTEQSVVYLRGEKPVFCAGADLNLVEGLDEDEAKEFADFGQRAFRSIERADPIVVAGIEGPTRGGGLELALACDLRIATDDATFAASGVNVGILGAWGGTHRLPKIVGEGSALDIELTGRVLDAQEALQVGLVTQIRDDPEQVARELVEKNSESLQQIKQCVRVRFDTQEANDTAEQESLGRLIGNVN